MNRHFLDALESRVIAFAKLMKFTHIFLFSVLSVSAYAETYQEKLEAARQVVWLTDYKAMFNAYLVQCEKSEGTYFDPIVLFKNDPGAFRGVSPQSAYWPEVEAAYRRYQVRVCGYLTTDEFTEFVARQFADRTSLDDLRASIAFQSSPAGRRIQQASVAVNEAFQAHAQASLQTAVPDAYKEVQFELAAIAEKYRRAPK
ncbi:DUF2059 domain-containing protein [Massilia horti]|uniref:DUF2059 domain-containing protein n=1 Tax=Massilia horti TaxID=2562153 RepID=A0A4Y9SMZ7_9BURK|nr:DUF2059 domain-containing protein [Massilia horti]TFW28025.1 DUF2059 domain-containing protein [Massilia horti]